MVFIYVQMYISDIDIFIAASRFFYASSACIYPEFKQLDTNVSLKESDAWPAEVCLTTNHDCVTLLTSDF